MRKHDAEEVSQGMTGTSEKRHNWHGTYGAPRRSRKGQTFVAGQFSTLASTKVRQERSPHVRPGHQLRGVRDGGASSEEPGTRHART
jgi:hypothetical protein